MARVAETNLVVQIAISPLIEKMPVMFAQMVTQLRDQKYKKTAWSWSENGTPAPGVPIENVKLVNCDPGATHRI